MAASYWPRPLWSGTGCGGLPGRKLARRWAAAAGLLLPGLVWTVAVIALGILGQDLAEVPLAEDQHVVQALAAHRSHEPLRECVRPWRSDRRLDHPRAVPSEG